MRPGRTVTAGAAMALAMVFSVQQGEHGPLVVYKLQIPAPAAPVQIPAPAAPVQIPAPGAPVQIPAPAALVQIPAPVYTIPERAPKILGTVAVPAAGWAVLPEAALAMSEAALAVPQAATLLELLARPAPGGAELAGGSGEVLTLEQVKDDLSWRRDTVEKLRLIPVAPRF